MKTKTFITTTTALTAIAVGIYKLFTKVRHPRKVLLKLVSSKEASEILKEAIRKDTQEGIIQSTQGSNDRSYREINRKSGYNYPKGIKHPNRKVEMVHKIPKDCMRVWCKNINDPKTQGFIRLNSKLGSSLVDDGYLYYSIHKKPDSDNIYFRFYKEPVPVSKPIIINVISTDKYKWVNYRIGKKSLLFKLQELFNREMQHGQVIKIIDKVPYADYLELVGEFGEILM